MDQDNHAEFINTYYKKLQFQNGPNLLKYSLSKCIVDYAKEHTDLHIIVCNSNRTKSGRKYLLEEIYGPDKFVRIIVHFNLPNEILHERVIRSDRSTNIFRNPNSNFKDVLLRQQGESDLHDVIDPDEEEADHLFVVKDNHDIVDVINQITRISDEL